MNADEIVGRLREYAKRCDGVHACWNEPTLTAAADLIESLQAQLAESKRRERAAVQDFEEYMLDSDDTPCGYCAHYAADKTCHPIKGPCNPKWKGRRGPQEAGEGESHE
jgi:hypothetical protein